MLPNSSSQKHVKLLKKIEFLCNFALNNMSISDLFDSGFRNRNKGHFSAIVRVALSDGTITPEEKNS